MLCTGAGEAEAEEPAGEIAAKLVLDKARRPSKQSGGMQRRQLHPDP